MLNSIRCLFFAHFGEQFAVFCLRATATTIFGKNNNIFLLKIDVIRKKFLTVFGTGVQAFTWPEYI